MQGLVLKDCFMIREIRNIVPYKVANYPRRMEGHERITIDVNKRSGKPRIRVLRITVYDVLE